MFSIEISFSLSSRLCCTLIRISRISRNSILPFHAINFVVTHTPSYTESPNEVYSIVDKYRDGDVFKISAFRPLHTQRGTTKSPN